MEKKSKKQLIVINIILFAILFGLVSLNKEFFRPQFNHIPFVKILTGSFPNFIAAYIISLALGNAFSNKIPKYIRLMIYISAILVFLILTFEEVVPLWGASTHYDFYDIVASGIGSFLAIITFELFLLKPWKRETN